MTVLPVLIGMVLCLGAGPIAAQQLSADQESAIKWLRLQPTGPITISMDSQVETWFEDALRPLEAEGYERSEWPVLRICVLNESTAILSGRYIRYRGNGSAIGEYGTSYVFARSGADWRIVSTIPHDPQKLLSC